MAVWPNIEKPSNLVERTKKGQIRSDFEAGYVQSRAQWTRARKIFELSWEAMTNNDKATLVTFFAANVGGTFPWTHSLTGTSYTVRFVEDELQVKYIPVNSWQVSVVLEEQ